MLAQIELETRREIEAMLLTWEDTVIARGKRDKLLQQLRRKFGELPQDIEATVRSIEAPDELDVGLDRLVDAASLDEMGLS